MKFRKRVWDVLHNGKSIGFLVSPSNRISSATKASNGLDAKKKKCCLQISLHEKI